MHNYEIRIVRQDDGTQIVITANLLGDHAAIRRAQMLANADDLVEVWRGMTCVFSTVPNCIYAH